MKCGRLILADRHLGVLQGSQGLLRDLFDSIVMVADEQSLIEATSDFSPDLVILDLSLSIGQDACLAERLLKCHPGLRLVVVCVHEEPSGPIACWLRERLASWPSGPWVRTCARLCVRRLPVTLMSRRR